MKTLAKYINPRTGHFIQMRLLADGTFQVYAIRGKRLEIKPFGRDSNAATNHFDTLKKDLAHV